VDGDEGLELLSLRFDWQYIGLGSVSHLCDTSIHPNLGFEQIHEPSNNPTGKFLGRVFLLLHRYRSHLLLQHVEHDSDMFVH
jgi:hypothetical protein